MISCSAFVLNAQCPLDLGQTTSPPVANLLQYFSFDGNLTNYGNSGQTAVNSGATFVNTQCGQGLSFDGINDYVLVSPNVNLINDFSITAWIKPDSQVNPMGIFSIREQCTNNYRGYSIAEFAMDNYSVPGLSNQVNKNLNCNGWSGGDRYSSSLITIPNNQETFVAVTVQNNNLESRIVTLYVDCMEYSTSMAMNDPTTSCFNNPISYLTTIGATSSVVGHTNTFDGTIDELRVYDVSLNHQQIIGCYESCRPISLEVTSLQGCNVDSADISLYNTQAGVEYQLINITTGNSIGNSQFGNCSSLFFSTGLIVDTTQFQIQALNTNSNCSIYLDTIITLHPDMNQPSFNLGNDTTLCMGEILTLNATTTNATYLWQNNSNTSLGGGASININQPGTYLVSVTVNNCTTIDSITINYDPGPLISLGNDTSLCFGETLLLNATTPNATYLWQDGSTSSTFNVNQQGTFWVEAFENNCTTTDSITVSYNADPIVTLGNDTTLCVGESLILNATTTNASYFWQDGSTISSFNVNQQGLFWVEVTVNNCTTIDSIAINYSPNPIVNLGNDTILCVGETLTLNATTPNATYLWQDGSTNSSFNINQQGVFWVEVTENNCTIYDSIVVDFISPPIFDLGDDSTLCDNDQIFLNAFFPNSTYLWQDNSTGSTFIVNQQGTFWVTSTNNCGAKTDSITINFQDCNCKIYIPNSFTPDNNGLNDTFYPQTDCSFRDYQLLIFNRWGEVIFESNDPYIRWDGAYKNEIVAVGTYIYLLKYISSQENEYNKVFGHVSVIR